jgi:hypothetical protein
MQISLQFPVRAISIAMQIWKIDYTPV